MLCDCKPKTDTTLRGGGDNPNSRRSLVERRQDTRPVPQIYFGTATMSSKSTGWLEIKHSISYSVSRGMV